MHMKNTHIPFIALVSIWSQTLLPMENALVKHHPSPIINPPIMTELLKRSLEVNNRCGICYTEEENLTSLPCNINHRFHDSCMNNWRKRGYNYCPYCNIPLPPLQLSTSEKILAIFFNSYVWQGVYITGLLAKTLYDLYADELARHQD